MLGFKTIDYSESGNKVTILDQTRLPAEEVYLTLKTAEDIHQAIKNMNLRGAPLIGVAAAYGLVLAAHQGNAQAVTKACELIQSARPTAVNLFWAIERMKKRLQQAKDVYTELLQEARMIEQEDREACQKIGSLGAELVRDHSKIMVHCNAGALATSGIGTALGIIYTARQEGKNLEVYSGETRPLLQGARLTSWELTKNGVETYTICDSMAGTFMPEMNMVIVGADRIAQNGDVANKIGTKGLAIIAQYYRVPFYVAAPVSTFDFNIASGEQIPIEERHEDEIRKFHNKRIVAPSASICNPAFDVTPSELITGIVTERFIVRPPYDSNIAKLK
ncbi:MAG: S-methyl-5-thioribose-1-phosphate isomerase [bacterium]